MPVIGAIFGAIAMGLIYWIMWGGGMSYIDARLNQRRDRLRHEEAVRRRLEGEQDVARAPLRSLTDPREGATVLMLSVAMARGEITPEQIAVVTEQMRDTLQFDADLDHRLSFCRFAAQRSEAPETAIDELAPLLRKSLEPTEQAELRTMLERVTALHGGPTDRQERFVELAMRRVAEVG